MCFFFLEIVLFGHFEQPIKLENFTNEPFFSYCSHFSHKKPIFSRWCILLCTLYSLNCTDYRVQTKQHRSPVLFEQKCVSFSIDADAPFSLLYFLREKENRIHIENVSHFADPSGHFFYHFRNHFLCLSLALYSYIFIHVFRLNIFIYWHRSSCPKFTAKNCLCKSRKS